MADDWQAAIAELRGEMESQFSGLMPRVDAAERGVSNFRAFTNEARTFFEETRTERALRKQREDDDRVAEDKKKEAEAQAQALKNAKKWKRSDKIALAGVLAIFIVPLCAWCSFKIFDFCSVEYKIMLEYEQLHHSELQHHSENDRPSVRAYNSNPQIANSN
jgi:hypothetical protein